MKNKLEVQVSEINKVQEFAPYVAGRYSDTTHEWEIPLARMGGRMPAIVLVTPSIHFAHHRMFGESVFTYQTKVMPKLQLDRWTDRPMSAKDIMRLRSKFVVKQS